MPTPKHASDLISEETHGRVARRLAITKRVSLAHMAESGWDDCYAVIRPASYDEYRKFVETDWTTLTLLDQIKFSMDFVAEHFVGGKIKVLDDDGGEQLVDMTKDDIYDSTALSDILFAEIVGFKLDPKGSQTAA